MILKHFKLRYLVKKYLMLMGRMYYFPRTHPITLLTERAVERSVAFIEANMPLALAFDTEKEILDYCLSAAPETGHYLGFGIYSGGTIRYMAGRRRKVQFHGFDSFEGLPENWGGYCHPKGAFSTGGKMPNVPLNVTLHKGWFDSTLPEWCKANPGPVAFVHIDCDLYSSAISILNNLAGRLQEGTILFFDEYFCYPNWEQHEHKAWQECAARHHIAFDYIAFSQEQVAVRIKSVAAGSGAPNSPASPAQSPPAAS